MKYKFIHYSKGFGGLMPDSKVTLSVDANSLRDLLDYFEQFLRGSGFCFKGHIEVVDNEEEDTDVDGREDSGEEQEASEEEQV